MNAAAAGAAIVLLAQPAGAQVAGDTPQGVDYLMAVGCGGLMGAAAAFSHYEGFRDAERAEQFRRWAEIRASEAGQDARGAAGDIKASKAAFLAAAGDGTNKTRMQRLMAAHAADYKVCQSFSTIQDVIIVGG
jgi:hypothetical protein